MSTTSFLILALLAAAPAQGNKYKLKTGAMGQVCLDCHGGEFQDVLKKKVLHTPVRDRECAGCHNPHASSHGKLLDETPGKSCDRCHAGMVPAAAKSTHAPLADKKGCTACHDPHASEAKNQLLKGGNALCGECHGKLVEAATKAKTPHSPVVDDCNVCHDPHGSANGVKLLKAEVPALCTNCHKPTAPNFARRHMNYDVAKARCTTCHDPHGSDARGMLHGKAHQPVARGMCNNCHEPPGSANQFKAKLAGANLCKSCHAQKMTTLFDKASLHRPVVDGNCLACHNPHASSAPGLLDGPKVEVCGRCHQDTIRRQERSPTKHEPVKDGDCSQCHDPHGSNNTLLLQKASIVETCAACHDWQKHSSHPIGADHVDKRNQNLRMDCLSCHRAHGTEYKHMFPYATTSDLCTKCHQQYAR